MTSNHSRAMGVVGARLDWDQRVCKTRCAVLLGTLLWALRLCDCVCACARAGSGPELDAHTIFGWCAGMRLACLPVAARASVLEWSVHERRGWSISLFVCRSRSVSSCRSSGVRSFARHVARARARRLAGPQEASRGALCGSRSGAVAPSVRFPRGRSRLAPTARHVVRYRVRVRVCSHSGRTALFSARRGCFPNERGGYKRTSAHGAAGAYMYGVRTHPGLVRTAPAPRISARARGWGAGSAAHRNERGSRTETTLRPRHGNQIKLAPKIHRTHACCCSVVTGSVRSLATL